MNANVRELSKDLFIKLLPHPNTHIKYEKLYNIFLLPFEKVKSQIVFRKFQQTGDQTGHWVWSVGNPSNPSLAAHIQGFPLVLLTSEKVVCASAFFYATPVKHPNFLARTDPTQYRTISPPYPEVTLDDFGFLVGGRLAARRAIFQPRGRILAILSQPPIAILSTLNFGPKTGRKMTHIDNGPGPGRNYGETTIDEEMAASCSRKLLEVKTF